MNRKLIFGVTGRLLEAMALLLLAPAVVCLIYREKSVYAFLITAAISLAIGVILRICTRKRSSLMYAKEGFLIVALAWLSMSLVGALPFVISREVPSYIDAFFETVSGFTTTGASVLTNVESLSHGILFWRSFTHWIGGMGVLVFILAFVSNISDRSIHILRAEMPGPDVGKLMPRSKDTSKILYVMYIVITLAQIIMLMLGGMPLFESILHTFGTAGTGGFSSNADSIASYSPYIQWVIAIFMLIFGVNFNLYYLVKLRRVKAAVKSTELWVYLAIAFIATAIIALNISGLYTDFEQCIRTAFFQVTSIVTTTGYATVDFNLWPSLSKAVLLILMFTGACAGSTAGGLKLSRVIILFKLIAREIRRMIHPRSMSVVKLDGRDLDDHVRHSVAIYFAVYIICILAVFLLLSFEPYDFETNFTAAVSCFNNVGPGFGIVGPMGCYAGYSALSKIVLSLAMLLGRLEIFPILIALIPSTWARR